MLGYRKPTGDYIEVPDNTPVSSTCVRVALRPSSNHVFSSTWNTDPLNAAVCWRTKTALELDAEKAAKVDTILTIAPAIRAVVDVLYPYLTNPPTRLQLLTAVKTRIKELV